MATHFCDPQYQVFPTLECLMALFGPGRSQTGTSSPGPTHICILHWQYTGYIGVTQGTVYSLVLMTIGALPPCGAFRFSQQDLSTQVPPVLFCFFATSVNISGTLFSCLNTGPAYFTRSSKNTFKHTSLLLLFQAYGSYQSHVHAERALLLYLYTALPNVLLKAEIGPVWQHTLQYQVWGG